MTRGSRFANPIMCVSLCVRHRRLPGMRSSAEIAKPGSISGKPRAIRDRAALGRSRAPARTARQSSPVRSRHLRAILRRDPPKWPAPDATNPRSPGVLRYGRPTPSAVETIDNDASAVTASHVDDCDQRSSPDRSPVFSERPTAHQPCQPCQSPLPPRRNLRWLPTPNRRSVGSTLSRFAASVATRAASLPLGGHLRRADGWVRPGRSDRGP